MPPSIEEHAAAFTRIENLLSEQLELARDTNKVVRSIRRANRIAFWAKLVLWSLVIVVPFLFIGPILKAFLPTANGAALNIFDFPSSAEIQKVIQTYRTGQNQ